MTLPCRQVLEESGFNVLDITEIGVGVLCTCSGGASIPSPRGGGGAATAATFLPHPDTLSEDTLIAEEEAHSLNHYGDRQGVKRKQQQAQYRLQRVTHPLPYVCVCSCVSPYILDASPFTDSGGRGKTNPDA